jgi:hypothetical protein
VCQDTWEGSLVGHTFLPLGPMPEEGSSSGLGSLAHWDAQEKLARGSGISAPRSRAPEEGSGSGLDRWPVGTLRKTSFVGWAFLSLGPSKSLLACGASKDFISISLTHLSHKEEGWQRHGFPH